MGSIISSILEINITPVLFMFGAIIGIVGFVSVSFFQLIHGIFNWVITDVVFNVPLTETVDVSGNLTFVGIGWTFTRDLANMFFILVLAFIAIATILRIRNYEAKKILPKLIIMALLINFSPVIVGVIVDFFNILMNFFLSGTSNALGGWAESMRSIGSYFGNLVGGALSVTKLANVVAYGITLIAFYFLATLVFGLIAILFLARIIAIWILVILAPIAFWGYIMPATKSWWSTWWKQLMQWSFTGATLAFFLYLGAILLNSASNLIDTTNLHAGGSIATIFPYFLSLGFLGIGIVFGLNIGGAGANMVMNWSKKAGKAVGGSAARKGVAWTKERATESEKIQKVAQRISAIKTPGAGEKGVVATLKRGVAGPLVSAPRWAARQIGPAMVESDIKDIDKKEGEILSKNKTAESKLSYLRGATTRNERVAGLRAIIESKQLNDAKRLGLTKEEMIKTGHDAAVFHPESFKKIMYALPTHGEEMVSGLSAQRIKANGLEITQEDKNEGIDTITKKIASKVKQADIEKMDQDVFTDKAIKDADKAIRTATTPEEKRKAQEDKKKAEEKAEDIKFVMHKFWTGEHIGAAGRAFSQAFLKPFQEQVNKLGEDWYEKNNNRLYNYLDSSAARALGVGFPKKKKEEPLEHPFPPGYKPGPGGMVIPKEQTGKRISEEELRKRQELIKGTKKEETSKKRGVPTMITRKMEEELKKRGYSEGEINKMTPQEAAEILGLI